MLKSLIETFPLLKTNLDRDSSVVEVDIVKDLAEEIIKMVKQCYLTKNIITVIIDFIYC